MNKKQWMYGLLVLTLFVALSGGGLAQNTQSDAIADVSESALAALANIQVFWNSRPFGTGSGFVIDSEGLVVTNYHVIEGADRISVTVAGQTDRNAAVVAIHKAWDLALLQIQPSNLPFLPLADSADGTRLGETVVAIGNPQGLTGTVSTGIVSARRSGEDLMMPAFDVPVVQTTAAISEGSSGGPMVNLRGDVIGIHAFMYTEGQNLNFAIPVDYLHRVLDNHRAFFRPVPGQMAVLLEWEGNFDLDLELWTPEGHYIGDVSWLSDSPDGIGYYGQEWIIFDADSASQLGSERFILSPYFMGPDTDEMVTARVTVFHPDGSETRLEQELGYMPPYDQWFAVEVDLSRNFAIVLDTFDWWPDVTEYQHQAGELAVTLTWKGDYDLDLEIWSEDFDYLNKAYFLGDSQDALHGDDGGEWFVFRRYGTGDFSTGRYVISPYYFGPESDEPVLAVVTVYFPDGRQQVIAEELSYLPPYDQWFAVLIDVDTNEVEVLDYFWD